MKIAKPTVHLNGTSKAELMEQLQASNNAITDAMRVLENNSPNARDYDLFANSDSFHNAQLQAEHRLGKLGAIREDIQEILEHVAEQA